METPRTHTKDCSPLKSSSVEANESKENLMGSAEITPLKKSPILEDAENCSSVARKRRLFVALYFVGTCVIAILSYCVGKFERRRLDEQDSHPHMIVETLWATPLARTHLRTHPKRLNLTEFNTRLADAVAKDYGEFQANYSDYEASEVNDLFFEYQVGGSREKNKEMRARVKELAHRKLPEFSIVASCAANLANRLMQKFGEGAMERCKKRLQGWATLHDSTSRHGLHVHAESTLSIVYYVRMGDGAPLRLYDPRGPRPPFEGSVEVWPEAGEMIAFPGWLAHEVENGSGRRVSLVFNVPGHWEGDEFGGESVGLGRWGGTAGWKLDFSEGVL